MFVDHGGIYEILDKHFNCQGGISIKPMEGGISGSSICRVSFNGGCNQKETVAIKTGPKAAAEINGFKLIEDHIRSLSLPEERTRDLIPKLLHHGKQRSGNSYLVLEYIPKTLNFAALVQRRNTSHEQILTTFRQILALKKQLWLKNLRFGLPEVARHRTIHRKEFKEVIKVSRIFPAVQNTIINGMKHPSLNDILISLHRFLFESDLNTTPFTICHSDLKGENILILPNGEFVWVDFEWAGWIDWTEALIRLAKWCTTKTIIPYRTDEQTLSINSSKVNLRYFVRFPTICRTLQKEAISFGKEFAEEIGDHDWERRFAFYHACSLLREVTLIAKRGLKIETAHPIIGHAIKIVSPYLPELF